MIRFLKLNRLLLGIESPIESIRARALSTIHSCSSEQDLFHDDSSRSKYNTSRYFSQLKYSTVTPRQNDRVTKEFMETFNVIVKDLKSTGFEELPKSRHRLAEIMEYNVPFGKRNRGLTVPRTLQLLLQPEELTPETMRLSYIVGWCIEMMHGCYLMSDDWADRSETRRGRLCWYKIEGNKLLLPTDALLLGSAVFEVVKRHMHDKPYYPHIIQLFNESNYRTFVGETEDILGTTEHGVNWEMFSTKRYDKLAELKTSYYTFYTPVAAGLFMANINDPEIHRKAEEILYAAGCLFQATDDFLDCFGDPTVTGKIGTDIQDGKCTWLAAAAMERANPQQTKIMKECYGSTDPKKVEKIKDLFREMKIPEIYKAHAKEKVDMIENQIDAVTKQFGIPAKIFHNMLDIAKKERKS